jgi:hypothetical protein
MSTDPNATPEQWANSLTADELAHQLDRLAGDAHVLERGERAAVLIRAANVIRA